MPSVASKYLNKLIDKYESDGYITRDKLSRGLITIAICAYTVKLTLPLIKKLKNNFSNNNNINNNNNNINNNKKKNNNNINYNNVCENVNNLDKTKTSSSSSSSSATSLTNNNLIIFNDIKINKQQQQQQQQQPGLNIEFLLQLKKIINIIIPKRLCYETYILLIHTICLISRTFLSIYVASMEGAIVKYIVRKDFKNFTLMLFKWFGIAIPATFINSMIRYLENKLALSFRTRLVDHSYKLYFKNQTYYRVSNLDNRIENADHRLTEDISTFSSSIAHLYSHLTKPCFDLMLIGLALARSSKKMKANIISGPLLAVTVISITAHIMRILSPKFGQLVSEEANRYGYLRHIHSRIITNAEEIAFYGGHNVELMQLKEGYARLVQQMNSIFQQKLWFVMLEQFFMKYVWSGTGMIMVSLPILTSGNRKLQKDDLLDGGVSERTQYLTTARNLLISGSDAVERLMSSYKEIVALAGYTYRVAGMLDVFNDVSNGKYTKTTICDDLNGIVEFKDGQPVAKGKIIYSDNPINMEISLIDVPVITPNCDVVVKRLTLKIESGMHVLITGPNGCGKSSLFRILSGLWPIYDGVLCIPRPTEGKPCMFYIPQRPYMSIGSLRDQIIYPDTREDMINKNYTEIKLKEIMKMVALEHIAARDNFDEVRDWKDILSGGEKQRMAIARLFYHRPHYALLDECTSAVSIDVESSIYEAAKNMGITLLTITHRPTLWKFHTHLLEFDGQGGWTFNKLLSDAEQKQPIRELN